MYTFLESAHQGYADEPTKTPIKSRGTLSTHFVVVVVDLVFIALLRQDMDMEAGVDRIVEQIVRPKKETTFMPEVRCMFIFLRFHVTFFNLNI